MFLFFFFFFSYRRNKSGGRFDCIWFSGDGKPKSAPRVHSSKHDGGLQGAWWIPVKKRPFVVTHPVSIWCFRSTLAALPRFLSPPSRIFFTFHARYARLPGGFSFNAGWTSSSSNSLPVNFPIRAIRLHEACLSWLPVGVEGAVNSSSFTVLFYFS